VFCCACRGNPGVVGRLSNGRAVESDVQGAENPPAVAFQAACKVSILCTQKRLVNGNCSWTWVGQWLCLLRGLSWWPCQAKAELNNTGKHIFVHIVALRAPHSPVVNSLKTFNQSKASGSPIWILDGRQVRGECGEDVGACSPLMVRVAWLHLPLPSPPDISGTSLADWLFL